MDPGFVEAQSDNLPRIDAFMMTHFLSNTPSYVSAEIKGVKASRSERKSYGDNAIGMVQVKRQNNICTVKAKITPEHAVRKTGYTVWLHTDEEDEKIISVGCEDCAAHLGGCKHAIAFLAWLHRRSEEPSKTDVTCYWKRSKLSSVGTAVKCITTKELYGNVDINISDSRPERSLLEDVIQHSKILGAFDTQLTKYFKEPSPVEQLSIHYLINSMPNLSCDANEFQDFCKSSMTPEACRKARLATKDQAKCPLWHELRYARITASKAYAAAHCKTYDGVLVEQILGCRKIKDTEAMARGRKLEKEVIKAAEKKIKEKINDDGIVLDNTCPLIGASPDGISAQYTIEVKCPMTKKSFCNYITKENKITAQYKAQVQLQLHMTKKQKALFIVAHHDFESSRKLTVVTVDYDREYCEDILKKCTSFWMKAIFPIISNTNKQTA